MFSVRLTRETNAEDTIFSDDSGRRARRKCDGADGAPTYTLQTLDEWIARVKAGGHVTLEEKQLKFQIERYSNIAHLWSSYALSSDGKQVARGINSIQAIKEAGGWRVTSIMVQAESATAPLPKEYLP
jgi:hypothetical protein